jgi:hypothetical protein
MTTTHRTVFPAAPGRCGAVSDRGRDEASLAGNFAQRAPQARGGSPASFVLPPVRLPDIWKPPGMTNAQINCAFAALVSDPVDDHAVHRFTQALDHVTDTIRELEAEIGEIRQQLLIAMYRQYPAAARRIMAGLQGKRPGKKSGRAKAG